MTRPVTLAVALPAEKGSIRHAANYPSLVIWRGIACLMVVAYHATIYAAPALGAATFSRDTLLWTLRQGEQGVTLFFVISGYCITVTALKTAHTQTVARYFQRRLYRIYPPYWAALALTAVAVLWITLAGGAAWVTPPVLGAEHISIIPDPRTLNAWQWVGNLTLTEVWRPQVAWRGGGLFVLGTAWTLCYEEQFYAVMGALIWCVRGRASRFFTAALWLSVAIAALWFLPLSVGRHLTGFFVDGRWLLFACGIAAYHALTIRAQRASVLLGVAVVIAAVRGDPRLAIAALFGIVLIALRPYDRAMMTSPVTRPLRWCGTVSYSLYLVHWPITKVLAHLCGAQWPSVVPTALITVPICLAASVACAWPFHRWIERRFLNTPASVLNRTENAASRPTVDLRQPAGEAATVA